MNELPPEELPLAGIRVLDLSRALAGPYCAQVLTDFGAECIKIEQPERPDEMRTWPPFHGELATYFAVANRNKRALDLDLKQPAGRELFLKLVAQADVVVENFRHGVTEDLRIGYEDLRAVNPRLVYCSVRGFGPGPHQDRPAYDAAIQAFTGIMSVTGDPQGDVQRAGVAVVDFSSGLNAANGVLAALHKRERTGRGSHVTVSLVDTGISTMAFQLVTYLMTGRVIERAGTTHPAMVPCRVFRASDGRSVLVVCTNNGQYATLCQALGHPEWARDERFLSSRSRVEHREEVHGLIEAEIARQPAAYWVQCFEEAGVPHSPVNRVDDLAADPEFRSRLLATVPHGEEQLQLVRSPVQLDGQLLPVRSGPPGRGEHSRQILAELGIPAAEIERLQRARVV